VMTPKEYHTTKKMRTGNIMTHHTTNNENEAAVLVPWMSQLYLFLGHRFDERFPPKKETLNPAFMF